MKHDPAELDRIIKDFAYLDQPSPGLVFVTDPRKSPTKTNADPVNADSGRVRFTRLDDLGEPVPVQWIMPGVIPAGAVTLLSASPKCGKSTLLGSLIRDLHQGGPLVANASDAPVVVLSEEPSGIWHERRRTLNLPGTMILVERDSFANCGTDEWADLIGRMADCVRGEGAQMAVVDTLASAWPCQDENNAVDVVRALNPLREISTTGTALLLIHHARKSGGSHGRAHRGSSALTGFPDVIADLRPFEAESESDNRRILSVRGRYAGLLGEVVLEYDGGEYRIVGDRQEAKAVDHSAMILSLLPEGPKGASADEIKAVWSGGPAKGTLLGILNHGHLHGKWHRHGGAVRNDPYRFCLRKPEASGNVPS
jgi:hypothetical protein